MGTREPNPNQPKKNWSGSIRFWLCKCGFHVEPNL